jgi:hypothetical protein
MISGTPNGSYWQLEKEEEEDVRPHHRWFVKLIANGTKYGRPLGR